MWNVGLLTETVDEYPPAGVEGPRRGTVSKVVFPTSIEEIDGQRFVFYGMADSSIGVAPARPGGIVIRAREPDGPVCAFSRRAGPGRCRRARAARGTQAARAATTAMAMSRIRVRVVMGAPVVIGRSGFRGW
jgi:hypothetical protein